MNTNFTPKRVLFVAYQFPPAGGIGVHRVVKFVKYLPEFGWESSVLTVSNPSVPLTDNSHAADIPATTHVLRARTWEPGYHWKKKVSASHAPAQGKNPESMLKRLARTTANMLFQPDMQILWAPAAIAAGKKLLRKQRHDAIIATAPPFSSFYVGEQLARYAKLPLILDYRDEWGISNNYWENKQQDPLSRWIQTRMQARILRHADAALATTPSSCASIQQAADQAGATTRCEYIYNGYDPDDFILQGDSGGQLVRQDYGNGLDKFRLAYAGTLWNLNSIEPLVQGLERLGERSPRLLERVEFIVAGRRTAEQEQLLDRLAPLSCTCVRLPFIPHDEAVRLMQTSDCLALLNSNVPGAERIVNGKIFEYLASRKPFLLISPRGDMWELTADCPYALPCEPARPAEIAQGLADLVEQHRLGLQPLPPDWNPSRHERRHRAAQLAQLLQTVTNTSSLSPTANGKLQQQLQPHTL
ncbi:MAG: glycosyltransferase [Planctomycetaceae bacterium]|nr:hypothetical protein [Planctomycetaceae bacterium]